MLFSGTGTALVTPFTEDGESLDLDAFRHLIDFQIDGGVECLVVLGTTGENPTVTDNERWQLVDTALEQANGRAKVVVGTGTNNTQQSVRFSRQAAQAGADGLLVVGPYYNKPTPAGFYAHVEAIADATDCPIVLYNVPGRTSLNLRPDDVLRLAEDVDSVVAVKEASGDLQQISDLLAHRPDDFAVYAGDDEITLPLLALGGEGVVSVIANAEPARFSDLVRLALEGDVAAARKHHFALLPAMRACFFETNPAPIKAVLAERGFMQEAMRLPLVPVEGDARRDVLAAFETLARLAS